MSVVTLEKPPIQVPTRILKVLPVLYRQGSSELREDGTVRLSISSDKPYLRYDWWNEEEYYEILGHRSEEVDLERIRTGTALLFNHDRDIQLGKIMQPELKDGKCFVDSKISQADDVASYRTRIQEGILKDSSVGYELLDDGEQVDDIDGVQAYRFRWRPFEASLVTIPADPSVGVGRERDLEKPKGEPREIMVREKSSGNFKKTIDTGLGTGKSTINSGNKTKATQHMTPEEQAAADEKARKQREADEKREAQERAEQVKDGVRAVREREKEIRAIAKRATNLPDSELDRALEDAIANENAVEAFRKLVFEKYFGKAEVIDTPSGQGNGDLKKGNGKNGLSIGTQFVESESFNKGIKERAQGKRTASIDIDFPILGIRGKVAMAQRAGFTSSDLAPVNVQIQPGVVGLGVQRLTIMDLIAPGATTAAAIIYARENSFGTVDGVAVAAGAMPRGKTVGERGLKPLWDPDLTTETAAVKKVAITTKVPDEFMSDFPSARSYIDERLPFMVDTETEFQLLYGDGLGNNLKGITSVLGIQTRAITTTDDSTVAASLLQGITDIRVGSFFEPDGYAFHPYDWETAKLLKDTNKRFLAGGPVYIPYTNGVFVEINTFWGKPVVVSTAVTYGKPLAGCWKLGAQYFLREGMRLEMTNANEDDFRRNLIMLRAEHRLALAVYRPVSFLEFTGFPARA
jgi:phage head maturation protease